MYGPDGGPWAEWHAYKRRQHLAWWGTRLGLEKLADVEHILPRVEQALRDLQSAGRAGKTVSNYAEAMSAFLDWCVERGYLKDDPLKALAPFDVTPQSIRRALTSS